MNIAASQMRGEEEGIQKSFLGVRETMFAVSLCVRLACHKRNGYLDTELRNKMKCVLSPKTLFTKKYI